MKRISVCIANYNGENLLPDCIESVLAQEVNALVEIIVHDDASTDRSVAMIKQDFPGVELVPSSENVGFCCANNRMVERSAGDYVLLLNNDAALLPGALAALLLEAEGVTNRKSEILGLPQYDWRTGELVDRGCLLDPTLMPIPNLSANVDRVAYIIGACMWLPKPLWRELGGFPDWMGSIGEDVYLCLAAALRGSPVRVLSVSGYRHRQGATFGGNRVASAGIRTTIRRRYLSERNRLLALAVMAPSLILAPWLLAAALALALEGLVFVIIRWQFDVAGRIYKSALVDFCRLLPRAILARRHHQAAKCIGIVAFLSCFRLDSTKLRLLLRYGMPTVSSQ